MLYDYNRRKYFKPKSETPVKPVFIFFALIILLFVVFHLRNKSVNKTSNRSQEATNFQLDDIKPNNSNSLSDLKTNIKEIIKNKNGTYSLYFKDLNSDEEITINEEMVFNAASVSKIPILASLYYLANQGELDLEKKITIQQKDIQDYGTGVIRYQGAGTVYSLKNLGRVMMENSDNTAAYILASGIIGLDKIQELVNSWGLTQTDIVKNNTSNLDMFKILKKMYLGEITNQSATLEMIGFMDDSDFEDRLPAKLPEGVKVYHKIGNEVNIIHDVGLIVLPNEKVYYLGILTSDITNEEEAKTTIAEISRLVYEYEI